MGAMPPGEEGKVGPNTNGAGTGLCHGVGVLGGIGGEVGCGGNGSGVRRATPVAPAGSVCATGAVLVGPHPSKSKTKAHNVPQKSTR